MSKFLIGDRATLTAGFDRDAVRTVVKVHETPGVADAPSTFYYDLASGGQPVMVFIPEAVLVVAPAEEEAQDDPKGE